MFGGFESPATGRELRPRRRLRRAAAADGVAAVGATPRVCVTENFVMFGELKARRLAASCTRATACAALRPLTALPPSARFRAYA